MLSGFVFVLFCVLLCVDLFCFVLLDSVLSCFVLCCAVLCCLVLSCLVLCCVVLCCVALCCVAFSFFDNASESTGIAQKLIEVVPTSAELQPERASICRKQIQIRRNKNHKTK